MTALVCEGVSLGCLAVPLIRGPIAWRIAAMIFALPALVIVSDFLRRAPHVFDWR